MFGFMNDEKWQTLRTRLTKKLLASTARVQALTSGRADVIVSNPYYMTDLTCKVTKK